MRNIKHKHAIAFILLSCALILTGCNPPIADTPPAADLALQFRKKNIRVAQLGRHVVFPNMLERWKDPAPLLIPPELRFKPFDAKSLLETAAKRKDQNFVWLNDGNAVVLFKKDQDAAVQRTLARLSTPDFVVRAQFAATAGSVEDPRVVQALVVAANAANNPDVASAATSSLRRLGWPAVLLLAPEALNLVAADLTSPDETVRLEALYALGLAGGDKAFALIEKIIDDNIENPIRDRDKAFLRGNAIIALAMADKDRALPVIEKLLEAKVGIEFQFFAVTALGEIDGDKSIALIKKELQPNVRRREPGDSYLIYINAIHSLQQIGSDRALAIIEPYLQEGPPENRWVALNALSQSGAFHRDGVVTQNGRERALALAEASLSVNSPYFEQSVEVLRQMGDESSLEILARSLRDRDTAVRVIAILDRMTGGNACTAFEPQFASKDAAVRQNAVAAMAHFELKRVLPYLAKAMDDEDAEVRRYAVSAIRTAPGPARDETVLPLLRNALADKDPLVRWYALNELSSQGALTKDIKAENSLVEMSVLQDALKDTNASTRATAVIVLQQMNGEQAAPLLDTALNDESIDVRRTAVASLDYLAGTGDQKAVALLGKALQNNDSSIREVAVAAICKNRRHFDQPTVLDLLKPALNDKDGAVRKSVVDTLGHVGGTGARDALIRQLAVEKDRDVLLAIQAELRLSWAIDGVAEKALREFKMPAGGTGPPR